MNVQDLGAPVASVLQLNKNATTPLIVKMEVMRDHNAVSQGTFPQQLENDAVTYSCLCLPAADVASASGSATRQGMYERKQYRIHSVDAAGGTRQTSYIPC